MKWSDLEWQAPQYLNVSPILLGYILPCCQVFAVYVLCGAQEKDAVRLTLEQLDVVKRMCTENQEFELVTSTQGTVHLKMGLQAHTSKTTEEMKMHFIIYFLQLRSTVILFCLFLVTYLQQQELQIHPFKLIYKKHVCFF